MIAEHEAAGGDKDTTNNFPSLLLDIRLSHILPLIALLSHTQPEFPQVIKYQILHLY